MNCLRLFKLKLGSKALHWLVSIIAGGMLCVSPATAGCSGKGANVEILYNWSSFMNLPDKVPEGKQTCRYEGIMAVCRVLQLEFHAPPPSSDVETLEQIMDQFGAGVAGQIPELNILYLTVVNGRTQEMKRALEEANIATVSYLTASSID
ncbi:hypothetical protein SAMN02745216_01658 [Desulfatibacillum alkenivorans DSM 16219]|jgi:hypothetical protein|uniref:Uncharacterized protein n=1 Tax=Desulfatibacillum alkenivorans DSM 16219 TaxID=1121393 RepID=A0A1M6J8T0_9BACT|nr:hypothetical protein [Desulfatibacillum alkenivorans]SHJ43050.1 hypothetical protein SAMN02745216_01658 [Desulfatibacillum alkenivorans DSM 16219]